MQELWKTLWATHKASPVVVDGASRADLSSGAEGLVPDSGRSYDDLLGAFGLLVPQQRGEERYATHQLDVRRPTHDTVSSSRWAVILPGERASGGSLLVLSSV